MQGTIATDKGSYVWGETVHHTWTADLPGRTFPWIRTMLVQDGQVVGEWHIELATTPPDVPLEATDTTKPAQGTSTLYAVRYKGHVIDSQTDLATATFDVA